MVVDSFLELYTIVMGWLLYGKIWGVLSETGLMMIPFFGIFFDGAKTAISSGRGSACATAIRVTALRLTGMVILISLTMPMHSLDVSAISFTPTAMQPTATESDYTISNSDSTYEQTPSLNTQQTVLVSTLGVIVHSLSIGVSRAIIEELPNPTNFRHLIGEFSSVYISDEDLQREVGDFKQSCFIPAKSKYLDNRPDIEGPFVDDIDLILEDWGNEDIHKLGSQVYLRIPGYYDSLRSNVNIKGFPYVADRDVEWDPSDIDAPEWGRPYCDKWWSNGGVGLLERIIDQASWSDMAIAWWQTTFTETKMNYNMAHLVLSGTPDKVTPQGYDLSYENSNSTSGLFGSELQLGARQVLSGVGVVYSRITQSADVTTLLNAAPIIQAFMIMGLTIFTPLILLFSGFSLSSILMISWGFFTLRFLTTIHFIAWWSIRR